MAPTVSAPADPGLRFWLRYVAHRGGLTEKVPGGTLVIMPPAVAAEFELPEELVVTADPDVAREDGTTMLATGHPALVRAADDTLRGGDTGIVTLAPPATPAPGAAWLQDRIREQLDVDHGRIDVAGPPVRVDRPMLRVGALVTYTVSVEECYQERLECWVDAASGLPLADGVVERLRRAAVRELPGRPPSSLLVAVAGAVDQAHALLEGAAERRRDTLSDHAEAAHRRELAHAHAYYAEALRSLERRRAAASPDRAELLAARAASTREERSRRLLEIDEKYRARHDIRPFRLHVVRVPGWRVPLDVRRGPRHYPFAVDWLPSLGVVAEERCPHCGAAAPLSASKSRLGCVSCLPGRPGGGPGLAGPGDSWPRGPSRVRAGDGGSG